MNFTKGQWEATYFDSTITKVRNGITVKEPEYLGVGVFGNPKGSSDERKATRMICKVSPKSMQDEEDINNVHLISAVKDLYKDACDSIEFLTFVLKSGLLEPAHQAHKQKCGEIIGHIKNSLTKADGENDDTQAYDGPEE